MANTFLDSLGLGWLLGDVLCNRTRAFFDASGNATKVVQPDDTAKQFAYNSYSEPTQITDEASHLTTLVYDSHGNLTSQKDAVW